MNSCGGGWFGRGGPKGCGGCFGAKVRGEELGTKDCDAGFGIPGRCGRPVPALYGDWPVAGLCCWFFILAVCGSVQDISRR